jgi:Holliday junction resolvase
MMRDELLRQLARRSMKRTANFVARDLIDSTTDQDRFEKELVSCFDSLGFEAMHIGGKSKPDGIAAAHLAADGNKSRHYQVSLEAKSKQVAGKKVQDLNIARIASHCKKSNSDHAVVVGADFTLADTAFVADAREIKHQTGKSITLIRAHDMAKLVRLRALLHTGLNRLQELFKTCVSPKESADWIEALSHETHIKPPYREILQTVWKLQKEVPGEAVEFSAVTTALRMAKSIQISKSELTNLCKAMEQMAREVVVRENTVELNQRPDKIIETAGDTLQQFPEDERKLAFKW